LGALSEKADPSSEEGKLVETKYRKKTSASPANDLLQVVIDHCKNAVELP
jgi:hypothetical protein